MASSRSCVIKTMVRFIFSCKSSNSSCICSRISGSRAEKASSINRTSGSFAKARANPTRCCIPPERFVHTLVLISFQSYNGYAFICFLFALFFRYSLQFKPESYITQYSPVRQQAKMPGIPSPSPYGVFATVPYPTEMCMFLPLNHISPIEGSFSRLMQRTNVDLPLPESPIITNISPSFISRLALRTAMVQPVSFKNFLFALTLLNHLFRFGLLRSEKNR